MGPLRLVCPALSSVPRQVANQAGSQSAIPEDSIRARGSSCAPRTHRTKRWIFALERTRLGRPIETSASEPTKPTHARISIKPLPPAWAVGISFSSHGQQFNFIRAAALLVSHAPAPRHRPACPHPRARSDPRFSERGARARVRAPIAGDRNITPSMARSSFMATPTWFRLTLHLFPFTLLLQVVAGHLRLR